MAPALAIGGSAFLALILWLVFGRGHGEPPPAPPEPPGVFHPTNQQWSTLTFATAQVRAFPEEIDTDGKIAAADPATTQVFAPVSGRVVRLFVQNGQKVRAGQPLAELEGVEYGQAVGDLESAAAQVKSARANEGRLAALYKDQGASLKDWQQSQTDLAAAENAQQNARARLFAMGRSPAEVRILEARRPGAPPRFILTAPLSGTIIQQSASPGLATAPVTSGGTTPLFTVSDLSRVWVVGALREEDSVKARPGQEIEARPSALPDRVIRGRLDYVAPALDPTTRRVLARATVENPDGLLRPEMLVDFIVVAAADRRALTVTGSAVIYEGERAHVWTADPRTKRLSLREVRPGRSAGGMVEIRSGLAAGEEVVARGALFIDQAAKSD